MGVEEEGEGEGVERVGRSERSFGRLTGDKAAGLERRRVDLGVQVHLGVLSSLLVLE